MTRVLLAEWTKLRTVASTFWTLLIAAVTALGGSVIVAFPSASDPNAPFDPVTGTFLAWGEYPVLAVGVLGALAVTSEYATGQIRTTFTAVPRRLHVLAAEAGVVGALVLVVTEVLAWLAFGATEIALALHNRAVSLGDPGVIRSVTMAGVSMAATAVLGVGVGAIARHTVGAVVAFPAVVFLPLALLTLPWSWGARVGRFGLLAAAYRLVSPAPHHTLLPVTAAVVVLLAWPAAALSAGALLIKRRDV
jgi:ABC-2 type transport system permease protein